MSTIPTELLEQLERGNVLLFIGKEIVRDADGQVFIDKLASHLAERSQLIEAAMLSFPEIAQAYEDERGRNLLIQFLRDQFTTLGDKPQPTHNLIAKLTTCKILVTTCLDQKLERAFEEASRPLNVIVHASDIPFEDEHKTQLYRLHGRLDQPASLILTEDNYENFFDNQASISIVLQGYLARKTILFLGYDLSDPHFKRLYRKVTEPLDQFTRRAYAVAEALHPTTARWCKRHHIDVLTADLAPFLTALTEQLSTRFKQSRAPSPQSAPKPTPFPERPYKFLDYYEAKDAPIFFGREWESRTLSALIHAHRLVLLYGASGTGKTSLLLAGAGPRLTQADPPYEILYIRALEDPTRGIRRALRRRLSETNLPEGETLADFLAVATQTLGRTLVIIFDQFEEFFIRLSSQFREAFITDLADLYYAHDLPVKIVLSLREDWLAFMSEIESHLPEVLYTRVRLLPLSRDQARQAITAPVERLGTYYEPTLVERLLDDLIGSDSLAVIPPQLQIVCSALYDRLEPDHNLIALTTYESLGGVRGILQQYLDDQLLRLRKDERVLAYAVLEELITLEGTKMVKTSIELAVSLNLSSTEIEQVLEKLVQSRLLRVLEHEEGGKSYELAHEYLIGEINLEAETQKRKQIEQLVRQEVENWQQFGTLIEFDKLKLIDETREALRLNAKAQELLLLSALQIGYNVSYWLERVTDPKRRMTILIQAMNGEPAEVRERAVVTLGQLGTITPELITSVLAEVLVNRLSDVNGDVRDKTVDTLIQIVNVNPTVATFELGEALVKRLSDADWNVRDRAAHTLEQMMTTNPAVITPELIEILVKQLTHPEGGVRARATRVLGSTLSLNPNLTSQVADPLIKLLTTEDGLVSPKTVENLAQIVAIDPKVASSQLVAVLAQQLSSQEQVVQEQIVDLLAHIGIANPELSLQVQEALLNLPTDADEDILSKVASAINQLSQKSI